jgi:hypothetical protein
MSQCAPPCCNKPATNRCSICLKEPYCSGECQKGDWKEHKKICKIINRLSNNLQPYPEAVQLTKEITAASGNIRIINYLLSYAQLQFDDRIPGEAFRQGSDSERIDNFEVEINNVLPIYQNLINIYIADKSLV